ncbi:MAG: tRNA (N(6)-L-threonylcarbamoyladenosine(37)-C(2))-methylthiotransferase [Sulfolobales archaeon]
MRVYIETYGCALNKADSAIMAGEIERSGGSIVDDIEKADVVIINTCIVRRETEERMILRLREIREKYIGRKKIIVAGCLPSAEPATAREIIPEASLVTTEAINKIVDVIRSDQKVYIGFNGESYRDYKEIKLPVNVKLEREDLSIPIPIAQGCLSDCSFCITKYSRPRLRSYRPRAIIRAVEKAVELGFKEIELTAQDTAVYGFDLERDFLLPELVAEASDIPGDFMIRIGMMNPQWLGRIIDGLIEVLKRPKVFKFIHIPVQSGDNRVLKIMKRGYTVEDFVEYVREFRNKIPDINIATDIIVGHPGEDEEAFMNTVKLVREVKFDRIHVAQYSIRPFTEAASMPQVRESVKKTRSSYLQRVQEEIGLEINREFIGKRVRVVITKRGYRDKTLIGRSASYRTVVVRETPDIKLGVWADVDITSATFFDLRGEVARIYRE